MSEILDLLQNLSPKPHGNYIECECPSCHHRTAFVYPKNGLLSPVICNRKNQCGFRGTVGSLYPDEFRSEISSANNQVNGFKPIFDAHGIDTGKLIVARILGQDISLALTKEFSKKPRMISGKIRWTTNCSIEDLPYSYYPVLNEGQDLYVFAGEWDYLKGLEDGLACTSSIFGESHMPTEADFDLFAEFNVIKIVLDNDKTGRTMSGKLALLLRGKFPAKQIEIIRLVFSQKKLEGKGKDFCDYRLEHSLQEFLLIQGVVVDDHVKASIAIERKKEKIEKKKEEVEQKGPQFQKEDILCLVGKYIVTTKGVFQPIELAPGFFDHKLICADPVIILERLQDMSAQQSYVKLEWGKQDKIVPMDFLIPRNLENLTRAGIRILGPNTKEMAEYFLEAINTCAMREIATRNGWYGEKFVLGEEAISETGIVSIAAPDDGPRIREKGDFEKWRSSVGRFTNDPQIQIAIGAAVIAPFLAQLGVENCTIHFWADSSVGKSFAQMLAASIWGDPENEHGCGVFRSWSGTLAGHEVYFHSMKNLPCFLDEAHLCAPGVAEQIIYQFGNGVGKQRATKNVKQAMIYNWRTLLLSSGEKRLSDTKTKYGGIGARVIEIFRIVYESVSEIEFRETRRNLVRNYGFGAKKIIYFLLQNKEVVEKEFLEILGFLETNSVIQGKIKINDLVKRLIPRWAAICLGAKIASQLFGWQFDEEKIWIEMLKSFGSAVEKPSVVLHDTIFEIYASNVVHFGSRTITGDIHKIQNEEFWGFVCEKSKSIYFLPEILKRELDKRGCIYSQIALCSQVKKDSSGKSSVLVKLNSVPCRMVKFTPKEWTEEHDEQAKEDEK